MGQLSPKELNLNDSDRSKIQQLELFQFFQPKTNIYVQPNFTFVDLFAGIGGFRIPLEELGGKCLGYSEIDKEAIKLYQKNFDQHSDETFLGVRNIFRSWS